MGTTWSNRHGIPDALVAAIAGDAKSRLGHYSVTQLIEPPRIRRLLEQHEVEADVSERLWALLGKGVHAVLEQHGVNPELEIAAPIIVDRPDGPARYWLSGTIDSPEPDGTIRDWKVTSTATGREGGRAEWEQQLNFYGWLMQRGRIARHRIDRDRSRWVAHQPTVPTRLLATMIFRDWSAGRASGGGDYPPAATATVEFPRWDVDEAERVIRQRLALHLDADRLRLPDLPPLCSDEDRWHEPDSWAVRRAGRKSALRVLRSEHDARAWAEANGSPGLSIEHRPGVDRRCLSYCAARTVCPHAIAAAAASAGNGGGELASHDVAS